MVQRGSSMPDMRGWTGVIVLAILTLAGCTSGIDTAKKAVPPTPTTPTSASPTPPTNATPNGTTPPTPPPPPVQFATKISHSYANAAENPTFRVPENAVPERVTLRIAPDATAACVTPDASIELRSPSGALVASLKATTPPPATSDACPAPVKVDRVALPPGTWTARFAGTGSALGSVEIVPSGGL